MVLDLIDRLCGALKRENINYCHWKSNAALNRSASGENDLDLLVDRAHAQQFTEILYRYGFKEFFHSSIREVPGIQNYFGYDYPSGRLVHVHAHYQLILGHDMTKNYRLPVESAYLESSVQGELFRVPAAEYELAVFVIRMILKHATWDVVMQGQGKLSKSELRELEDLMARADKDRLMQVVDRSFPFVSQELFENCMRAVQPGCSVWFKIKTGQRLTSRLQAHARRGQLADACVKFGKRLVLSLNHRLFKKRADLRVKNGGAMIAIIGGDGSGKTTAIDGLEKWLSAHFMTARVHLGRPTWSLWTILIRGFLKVGRLMGMKEFNDDLAHSYNDSTSNHFPGYVWMLQRISIAYDRFVLYRKARLIATEGGLVLCDRFPVPDFMEMDGPWCERIVGESRTNRFTRILVELEKRLYQHMMLPEVLIVLRLDPDIAVERKTDESPDSVRKRSTLVWQTNWQETPACVVDASQSKEVVLSQLKSIIWSKV